MVLDFSFIPEAIGGMERFLLILAILFSTFVIVFIFNRIVKPFLRRRAKWLRIDETQLSFMIHFTNALFYLLGIGLALYTVPFFRTIAISVFAGAGILAVIIGFASQEAFSNIVAGIFIAIFKPFRVHDWIKISDTVFGSVEDITLRHTVIRNPENKRIIIPNSLISNEIIENANLIEEKICRLIDFDISYDADINKAMKIMQKVAMKHPFYIDNRTKSEREDGNHDAVSVRVMGFGDSSVKLRAWVWSKNQTAGFKMEKDLNKQIKEAFDKNGIEIPFPYRTIVYKKDMKKRRS